MLKGLGGAGWLCEREREVMKALEIILSSSSQLLPSLNSGSHFWILLLSPPSGRLL